MDDGAHTGGVQHHYMHGLCFDGMWDYHTRSRKGRKSWARLDLGSDSYPWTQEDDPEGAGWCVRCCASVLGQRPVPLTHMQNSPTPTGDPASVAFALRELLPKFEVDVQLCTGQNVIQDVEKVIKGGGSMLVRLKRASGVRQIRPAGCGSWEPSCDLLRIALLVRREHPKPQRFCWSDVDLSLHGHPAMGSRPFAKRMLFGRFAAWMVRLGAQW